MDKIRSAFSRIWLAIGHGGTVAWLWSWGGGLVTSAVGSALAVALGMSWWLVPPLFVGVLLAAVGTIGFLVQPIVERRNTTATQPSTDGLANADPDKKGVSGPFMTSRITDDMPEWLKLSYRLSDLYSILSGQRLTMATCAGDAPTASRRDDTIAIKRRASEVLGLVSRELYIYDPRLLGRFNTPTTWALKLANMEPAEADIAAALQDALNRLELILRELRHGEARTL